MRPSKGYSGRGSRRSKEPPAAGPPPAITGARFTAPPLSPPQPPPPAEEGHRSLTLVRSSSTRSMTIHRSRENIATATAAHTRSQPPSRASSKAELSDEYYPSSDDTLTSGGSQDEFTPVREPKKKALLKKKTAPTMTPVTPMPDPLAGARRRRSPHEDDDPAKRVCAPGRVSPPSHSRRVSSRIAHALAQASPPPAASTSEPPPPTAPRTYASAAAERAPTSNVDEPMPSISAQHDAEQPPTILKPKYPPIVVEVFPNWPYHMAAIREQLGRTANARPFSKSVRFMPADQEEYRFLQSYLGVLEQTEKLSWHSYTLPEKTEFKVAIRGLPHDSPPDLIIRELELLGFSAVYVHPIRARGGRPGCIHYALLQRSHNITEIYNVTELLGFTGVVVQGWRSKGRPAQCHCCQQFRHSSHNCHRPLACVRCGNAHLAKDCSRPRESPATCVNCGGPHPANYSGCPVLRREARNRRAGTEALSKRNRRPTAPEPPTVAADPQASSLMAPANTPHQQPPPSKRKKKKKKRGMKKEAATQTTDVATPIVSVATPIAAVAPPTAPAATTSMPPTSLHPERHLSSPIPESYYYIHVPISTVMLVLQTVLQALDAGRPYDYITDVVAASLSEIMLNAKPSVKED